ncbi:MAG: type III-B CRISPR-associated protein Cas10/Cmr2 [Methylococcales bacterium]|nr:type III-B CRISPR-associated protein Cas10/Cmr2 [Methylococcales bacterium]
MLYPAVFDLAERVLAAAKASRPFAQSQQQGWRCSLTGEHEWLTTDVKQLHWNQSYRQQQGTLWTKVADEKPAWAKKGEHLSALPSIKRLWPTLFRREVGLALAGADDGSVKQIDRFVVSTHTMALAHQLNQFRAGQAVISDQLAAKLKDKTRVALPAQLAINLLKDQHPQSDLIVRIPGWLEDAKDSDNEADYETAQRELQNLLGGAVETYYSLIMMDGDRMGAILSGDETTQTAISYRDSFYPKVQRGFDQRAARQPELKAYGEQKRAVTPNRHLAISGALNDFSQIVVRHVVEREHLGRLIYAGGDDVLAMLPVTDLFSTMQRLRHAYSGTVPEDQDIDWGELRKRNTLVCKQGFAWLNGRLMRMMGKNATASCGAVIAHHQAPLSAVMRELRAAEQRAKTEGGRDAFSVTVIKRSGGALYFTEKWGEPVNVLIALRDFLVQDGVSRRAVYHILDWLDEHQLPENAFDNGMAQTLLQYQLDRQAQGAAKDQAPDLALRLVTLALAWSDEKRIEKMRNLLAVAEFLARAVRTGDQP